MAEQVVWENQDCRVVAHELPPGQTLPEQVSSSTVLLVVLAGRGRLRTGAEERRACAGDLAVCRPQVLFAVEAEEETLRVLVVFTPRL